MFHCISRSKSPVCIPSFSAKHLPQTVLFRTVSLKKLKSRVAGRHYNPSSHLIKQAPNLSKKKPQQLMLNLESVNRWQLVCGCLCSHLCTWDSLLIVPQSLHLSVCQPELMDLSADRQTARCQLCSVQPDSHPQCISALFPEING